MRASAIGSVVGLLLLAVAGQAQAQSKARAPAYPFIGTWDCEVATFTFTGKVYNNGSENMPIRKVVTAGRNEYRLDFDKGYKISLQLVNPKKMNWMSHSSGDGFTCKRLK